MDKLKYMGIFKFKAYSKFLSYSNFRGILREIFGKCHFPFHHNKYSDKGKLRNLDFDQG